MWDVWQYWVHRCQHMLRPALWETHKFHHSDAALNTSSQARHHFSSHVVYTVSYAPLLLVFWVLTPHVVVSVKSCSRVGLCESCERPRQPWSVHFCDRGSAMAPITRSCPIIETRTSRRSSRSSM